jgi:ubiquinone/menaquinone biosynthesis C-methylase UbiE
MSEWSEKLFINRADLSTKIMNQRWPTTEPFVDAIINKLGELGIKKGHALDICCGNGRISIHLAKKGWEIVGIDFSKGYLDDAVEKAKLHGVANLCTFIHGDVIELSKILERTIKFDLVVNAWTSIGYTSVSDDESIFRQAREASRKGAVLMILDTMHAGRALNPSPGNIFMDLDDMVMLEKQTYDPLTSRIENLWSFYSKDGRDLRFVDDLEYRIHVYSASELTELLAAAGWRVEEVLGSIVTGQRFSSQTGMNIVARAI